MTSLPPPRSLLPQHLSGIDHLLESLITIGRLTGQMPFSANITLIDVLWSLVRLKITVDMYINQGCFCQKLRGVLIFSSGATHVLIFRLKACRKIFLYISISNPI